MDMVHIKTMMVVYPTFNQLISENGDGSVWKKHVMFGVPHHKGPFKHVSHDFLNGFGGKVRPGEDVHAATLRELREETDLMVWPNTLRWKGLVFVDQEEVDHIIALHVYEWRLPEMIPEIPGANREFKRFDIWRLCDGRDLTRRNDLSILPADKYWLVSYLGRPKKRHVSYISVTRTFEIANVRIPFIMKEYPGSTPPRH